MQTCRFSRTNTLTELTSISQRWFDHHSAPYLPRQVTLRDSNAEGGATGAAARLGVVEPASVTVTSPSHADWVAVTGQRVRLQCHLWDALGNRLWIGEVGGAWTLGLLVVSAVCGSRILVIQSYE